jgi:hypothetical protein
MTINSHITCICTICGSYGHQLLYHCCANTYSLFSEGTLLHNDYNSTGSPQFAPVQFALIQNNADFEVKKWKKYILLLFTTFYNCSHTASYTKS